MGMTSVIIDLYVAFFACDDGPKFGYTCMYMYGEIVIFLRRLFQFPTCHLVLNANNLDISTV